LDGSLPILWRFFYQWETDMTTTGKSRIRG